MDPSDLQLLGTELRVKREQAGMSVRTAAERSGLVPSTLWRIEAGKIENPRVEHLQAMARAYGTDVEDFYALAGYLMPEGLPELRPYLRAKYGLPEQAADQIDEYFQALRTKWQADQPTDQETPHYDGGQKP